MDIWIYSLQTKNCSLLSYLTMCVLSFIFCIGYVTFFDFLFLIIKILFYLYYCCTGGTLWHIQKLLQNILVKFTPSIIPLYHVFQSYIHFRSIPPSCTQSSAGSSELRSLWTGLLLPPSRPAIYAPKGDKQPSPKVSIKCVGERKQT
jgi:hypothetical protein